MTVNTLNEKEIRGTWYASTRAAMSCVFAEEIERTFSIYPRAHSNDVESQKFLADFFKNIFIKQLWCDVLVKRKSKPQIVGLTAQQCKKRGIDKGFTTVNYKGSNKEKYIIYYNSSIPNVEAQIYLVLELMNLFNWEKYEALVEAAKKGKLGKDRFAYLCEANEWQNLHLASDPIFRLAPALKSTAIEDMIRDFDLYYKTQKKSGHVRKYKIQWHVLRAVHLFKRIVGK